MESGVVQDETLCDQRSARYGHREVCQCDEHTLS